MATHGGILVVGGDGMIGRGLVEALRAAGHDVRRTGRRGGAGVLHLDLAADNASWTVPVGVDVAYLCAAVTASAECLDKPVRSRAVNVEGTIRIGRKLVDAGCRVIFVSTNMVFDGARAFEAATVPPAPRTAYGSMKAEAERGLLALNADVCVVRFSKVLGPHMPLVTAWREMLLAGRPIHPLTDLVLAPVTLDLAIQVLLGAGTSVATGILQFTAARDVSYADVARRLAETMDVDAALVQPLSSVESSVVLEHVPHHTTLDSSGATAVVGLRAPDPWQAIDRVLMA